MSIKEPVQNEEDLLEKHVRLVHYIVNKLNLNYEYDELVQVGSFGLLKAIRTFDGTKAAFATYASRCITNQLLMHHRGHRKHIPVLSLDGELTNSKGDSYSSYDILEAADSDETGIVEAKMVLQQILSKLSLKEIEIMQLKLSGKKQNEIGNCLNLSQSYVSRIIKNALGKISRHLEPHKGGGFMSIGVSNGKGRNVRVGPRAEETSPEPSPVKTYYLSPEEIIRKYGPDKEAEGLAKKVSLTKEQVEQAIENTNSITDARKSLGIATQTMYNLMKRYGLKGKNRHGYNGKTKEEPAMENISEIITTTEQVEQSIEVNHVATQEQESDYSKLSSWLDMDGVQESQVTVNMIEPDPVPKRGTYEVIGQSVGRLVDTKQAAYGGIERVHAAMRIFYPEGIPGDKLSDALLILRILDKVNRISGGDKNAFGESPFRDIAGYSILGFTEEA